MREILFQNSIVTLKSLSIALLLGLLFTGLFSMRYVQRHKMNLSFLNLSFIPVLLFALLMGRVVHLAENYQATLENPLSALYVWDFNYSFFGMALGGIMILYLLTRFKKENFWSWLDVAALSSVALLFFVHVGYFFSGTDYGEPTTLPWGIAFKADHIPFVSPLHPIQLYAAIFALILLSWSVKRSKRTHLPGVIGARAILYYSTLMFALDFLKGNDQLYYYNKLGYAILAIGGFIVAVHCSHQTHLKEVGDEDDLESSATTPS